VEGKATRKDRKQTQSSAATVVVEGEVVLAEAEDEADEAPKQAGAVHCVFLVALL
jgi:hypothetical protein